MAELLRDGPANELVVFDVAIAAADRATLLARWLDELLFRVESEDLALEDSERHCLTFDTVDGGYCATVYSMSDATSAPRRDDDELWKIPADTRAMSDFDAAVGWRSAAPVVQRRMSMPAPISDNARAPRRTCPAPTARACARARTRHGA